VMKRISGCTLTVGIPHSSQSEPGSWGIVWI